MLSLCLKNLLEQATEFYVVVGVAQDRTAAAAIGGSFSVFGFRNLLLELFSFR